MPLTSPRLRGEAGLRRRRRCRAAASLPLRRRRHNAFIWTRTGNAKLTHRQRREMFPLGLAAFLPQVQTLARKMVASVAPEIGLPVDDGYSRGISRCCLPQRPTRKYSRSGNG
jgi:hypothetical protein